MFKVQDIFVWETVRLRDLRATLQLLAISRIDSTQERCESRVIVLPGNPLLDVQKTMELVVDYKRRHPPTLPWISGKSQQLLIFWCIWAMICDVLSFLDNRHHQQNLDWLHFDIMSKLCSLLASMCSRASTPRGAGWKLRGSLRVTVNPKYGLPSLLSSGKLYWSTAAQLPPSAIWLFIS